MKPLLSTPPAPDRLHATLCRHRPFVLLLLLFVSFRLLAILLFRPGGFIADFSDYDFYLVWGQLSAKGYTAYQNLWTAYPPLFPALLQRVFALASLIPPWVEPRLFFHTLLGMALLLFESANLLLIYRLGLKLASQAAAASRGDPAQAPGAALQAALVYALLFVPVYTLLGWFEAMPLFWLLWSLDLLLTGRGWAWGGSAAAAALGFLTKLTPALMLPIAIRSLGSRLSWSALRHHWFAPRSPQNLLRPALYTALFVGTVVAVGYPLVAANPALALSSLRVQSIRPPWQSLWALLDGFYGFGLVPLDMRNLAGLEGPLWQSGLPWGWISIGFGLVYLWLYTRPYDWQDPRTPVAFAAVSVIWLFLYSKGWSPQFLVWILAFVALLLPTLTGVLIAIGLSLLNFVEAHLYLILLPGESWLLWTTVLARGGLLLGLSLIFLGQIWPSAPTARVLQRIGRVTAAAVLLAALGVLTAGSPRLASAYSANRLAAHPCPGLVPFLQAESGWPPAAIATAQIQAWENLYPWLHRQYNFEVVDDYVLADAAAHPAVDRLQSLAAAGEFWWVEMAAGEQSAAATEGAALFFARPNVHRIEETEFGTCTVGRVVQLPPRPLARMASSAGTIDLTQLTMGEAAPGAELLLLLYWQALSPITESFSVFTKLFDPAGQLVAQQDNLPVQGLAPTQTWTPRRVVRDPYRLALPASTPVGTYQLQVGLYTSAGPQPFTLADGSTVVGVTIPVQVGRER